MFAYYFKLGLRSLRRNRVLTALMVFAIGFGVAASMVTYAVFRATSNNPIPQKSAQLFAVQIDNWGPDNRVSKPGEPADELSYTDAMALMQARWASHQTALYPVGISVVPEGRQAEDINAYAVYTEAFGMFDVPFLYGGGWAAEADDGRAAVTVISRELNQQLFGGANSVGRQVNLDGHDYRITGVMDHWDPQPLFFDAVNTSGFSDPVQAFIPFSRALDQRLITAGNNNCAKDPGTGWDTWLRSECTWVTFWAELPNGAEVARFRDRLRGYAGAQQRSGRFHWAPNVRMHDVADWLDYEQVVPKGAKVSLVVAVSFLVVCLVNTVGLLLAKFMRRAREIGVRRALGASRRAIYAQFLIEAATVGLAGGILGLLLTVVGMTGIGLVFPPEISRLATLDASMVALTLGVSMLASLLASFYPTWRAAQVQPAWQLKSN
jgi:putative ABC transport system permease protein